MNQGEKRDVIDSAFGEMVMHCGNAGQVTILHQGRNAFENWADEVLDGNDPDIPLADELMGTLGMEKYDATDEIWGDGEAIVVRAAIEQQAQNALAQALLSAVVGGKKLFGRKKPEMSIAESVEAFFDLGQKIQTTIQVSGWN